MVKRSASAPWAAAILEGAGQPRRDTADDICRAGYDIVEETRKMEEFFCRT